MKQYFIWEWRKYPLGYSNKIAQIGMGRAQELLFYGVDKTMAEIEGMKLKDIRREWTDDEERIVYKETENAEEIEKLKYKLENMGVAKINETIMKAKNSRLIPPKIRNKLGEIKYSEGRSPIEKTQDALMLFGIHWGFRIIGEKEFQELQAKEVAKNI